MAPRGHHPVRLLLGYTLRALRSGAGCCWAGWARCWGWLVAAAVLAAVLVAVWTLLAHPDCTAPVPTHAALGSALYTLLPGALAGVLRAGVARLTAVRAVVPDRCARLGNAAQAHRSFPALMEVPSGNSLLFLRMP